jgi:uncharacterized delta-60 repeat protein
MKLTKHTTLIAILLIIGLSSKAQPIIQDSTFNGTGTSLFTFFGNINRGFGTAIQSDLKMVVVGLAKNPATNFFEMCLARYNVDGTLDTTFSNDGKAFVVMGNQSSIGGILPKIKIDANENIVLVAAGRGASSQDFLVARVLSNGTPDLSFNGSGSIFVDILGTNTQPDGGAAFDFDANGNIYVTGVVGVSPPFDNQLAVIKLTSAGVLDNTFDTDGIKYYNIGTGNEFGSGLAVLSTGNIIVGYNATGAMNLLCIDTNGAPITSFNGNGIANISFSTTASMTDLGLDKNGRIVVCGTITGGTQDNIAVARYLLNGTPDPTFGVAGKFENDVNGGDDNLSALCVLGDNKILVAGATTIAGNGFDFLVARIDTNGTLDNTFHNGTGIYKMTSNFPAANETFYGVSAFADGTIFLAGTAVFSAAVNEQIFVTRLKKAGPLAIETITQVASTESYPNPFDSELIIECNANSIYWIKDIQGKTIQTLLLNKGKNSVSLSNLAKGIYFISDAAGGPASKIIKAN